MVEAFISYAREDRAFVDALAAALEARGRSLWIDRQKIRPLTQWLAELLAAIANAEHFVIVLSPDWLESRVCPSELEEAIGLRKALVPLHWREVDPELVHPDVRALHWVDFRDPAAFDRAVDDLLEALDHDLERIREQTRLLRRALDWMEQGRRRENLLAGADLSAAEGFLAAHADVPDELRHYVEQSRAEATRARNVRRGVTAAALVVLAAVGAWVFTEGRRMRAEGASRAMAMKARDLGKSDPDRALLHAIEACRIAPTHEAKNVLWMQLSAAPNLLGVAHRHRRIMAMALHPDGRRVALGDGNSMIAVLDASSRRVLSAHKVDANWVRHVAWAGDTLVSIDDDENVTLWDSRTGAMTRRWHLDGVVSAMTVDRAGKRLAVAQDGVVNLYDLDGAALPSTVMRFRGSGHATSLAFSDDGTLLAAGATDGTVYLYSPDAPPREAVVREGYGVSAVAFSPDGTVLAASSDTGLIALLRTSDLSSAIPSLLGHGKKVTSLDFDAEGELLVSASEDETVRLWNWRDSDEAQPPLVFHREEVVGAAFGAGGTIVSAGESLVLLWRTARHRELAGHSESVSGLAWTQNGTLYSSSWDRTVRGWDPERLTALHTLTSAYDTGRSVAVAPDGSFVASSSWNGGHVVAWVGARPARLRSHRGTVWALAADERHVYSAVEESAWVLARSPKKNVLVAGTGDGVVRFPEIAVPAHASSRVRNLGFSADGTTLMSHAESGQIAIWDMISRAPRFFAAQPRPVAAAALSPDGTIVAAASPRALMLLNAATGERIGAVVSAGWSGEIARLSFSPDGDTLAVASGARIQLVEAGPRAWIRRGCSILRRSTPDADYPRVCGVQ